MEKSFKYIVELLKVNILYHSAYTHLSSHTSTHRSIDSFTHQFKYLSTQPHIHITPSPSFCPCSLISILPHPHHSVHAASYPYYPIPIILSMQPHIHITPSPSFCPWSLISILPHPHHSVHAASHSRTPSHRSTRIFSCTHLTNHPSTQSHT
jgi:hypothetical protein